MFETNEAKEADMQTTSTSKPLIGLTLILVVTLLAVGVYFPGSLMMAFAGTGTAYVVLRAVIAMLLIGLLLTKPPRSVYFRTMLGTWAVALSVVASQLLLTYQIHLLDAVMFIEVAIIFGVEALESGRAPVVKKIPVRKIPARQRITVVTASS